MGKIRWKLVFALSSFGVAYGVLTIFALIQGYEHLVALIVLAGVGKLAVLFERQRPLRHAFLAGFLTAILAVWTQMMFADSYFKNNPEYLLTELPFGLSPVAFSLLFSPIGGIAGGMLALVTALIVSVVVNHFWTNNKPGKA